MEISVFNELSNKISKIDHEYLGSVITDQKAQQFIHKLRNNNIITFEDIIKLAYLVKKLDIHPKLFFDTKYLENKLDINGIFEKTTNTKFNFTKIKYIMMDLLNQIEHDIKKSIHIVNLFRTSKSNLQNKIIPDQLINEGKSLPYKFTAKCDEYDYFFKVWSGDEPTLMTEGRIYYFLSHLRLFTPCIVKPIVFETINGNLNDYFDLTLHESITPNQTDKFHVIVTKITGKYSLDWYFDEENISDRNKIRPYIRQIIWMLIYTLGCFVKCGVRHNDLHMSNIRIHELDHERRFEFIVDKQTYYLQTKYIPYIFDFDLASQYELIINDGLNQPNTQDMGQTNVYNMAFDMAKLLGTLYFYDEITGRVIEQIIDPGLLDYFERTDENGELLARFNRCYYKEFGNIHAKDMSDNVKIVNELLDPILLLERFDEFKVRLYIPINMSWSIPDDVDYNQIKKYFEMY